MKNLYKRFIQTGQEHTKNSSLKKKIVLLNTYLLIWMHLSCFFILLDVVFRPPNGFIDIFIHSTSLIILFFLWFLNYKNQFKISRILYLILSITVYYILSFVLFFSPYTVCYFILLPLVVMSLYQSNVPAYIFLTVCLVIYNWSDLWLVGIDDWKQFIRCLILLKDPVVTSLFFASFYLFHYFKKLNQSHEQELELAYEKLEESKKSELAHLQLKSLKAQMNPHFMFNAMNSIQSLVLKGDRHEAYNYLSKFSAMIRENLNMSEKSFVSFSEELSLLKKYLELEKLRFHEDFEYQLIGTKIINDVRIPSMIIQPFIENAIKHGLLHKTDGVKKLTIEFVLTDIFKCIITDNGVGIEKSKTINHQNDVKHKSFSTQAIEQRLTLLKDYYKIDVGFEYIDIEKGTQVLIKIPYIHNR